MEIGNMEPIMGYIGCKDKFVNKKKEKEFMVLVKPPFTQWQAFIYNWYCNLTHPIRVIMQSFAN
jgi:hypothetical protein